MSRLTDAAAAHRQAQHVADWAADRVARATRELRAATESQAKADEEVERTGRELAEARAESLGAA